MIGMGMLGVLALYLGIEPTGRGRQQPHPADGLHLPAGPTLVALAFIMIIGSLSSTADSDLTALTSIVMTDIYGQYVGRKKANPRSMILIGRITMIVAIGAGAVLATAQMNILDLLVFVGALWGCLVFPVIASFYWNRVTNVASRVGARRARGLPAGAFFLLIPLTGAWALFVEVLAVSASAWCSASCPSDSSACARP